LRSYALLVQFGSKLLKCLSRTDDIYDDP
jgi:hypothetical protein